MSDYLIAILLGVVEGLTEFIPVSSTAHIRIAQDLLQIPAGDEFWKMFAIVIQLGAILAVVVYFARRLIAFTHSFLEPMQSWSLRLRHPFSLVLLSFAVTAVPCLLMDKLIGENLENMLVIALALIIGGVLMWWIDWHFSRRASVASLEAMTLWQAIAIGAAQILAAAFPGTSRSMSTIAAGQVVGLSRSTALEFSFFLSIPVMVAATGYKFLQFMLDQPNGLSGHQFGVVAIGFIVSFVVALAVVAWLMQWVKRNGFVPFAIYRIAVGVFVLGLLWSRS